MDMDETTDPEAGFLEQLGQRVRTMRALRGMSRKVLARVSGISERYIAQLEGGKGNVSIVLLRRVANAMGAHLEDLIPSTDPAPDWQVVRDLLRKASPGQIAQAKDILAGSSTATHRRTTFAGIALIGLRGAGKSTLGAALAANLKAPFIELDREIEREAGTRLSEIFLLYGQPGYRRYEHLCLEKVLNTQPRCVIATGGSIVSEAQTYALLRSSCFTVWLKAKPEEHMARVTDQGDMRPMAGNARAMADLKSILQTRNALYGQADAVVDTSGRSAKQSLRELKRVIAL